MGIFHFRLKRKLIKMVKYEAARLAPRFFSNLKVAQELSGYSGTDKKIVGPMIDDAIKKYGKDTTEAVINRVSESISKNAAEIMRSNLYIFDDVVILAPLLYTLSYNALTGKQPKETEVT